MGRIFGQDRYDTIRKEFEEQEDWADSEFTELDSDEVYEEDSAESEFAELDSDEVYEEDSAESEFVELDPDEAYAEDFIEEFTDEEAIDTYTSTDMSFEADEAEELGMELVDLNDAAEDEVFEEEEESEFAGILNLKTLSIILGILIVCLIGVFGFSVYKGAKEREAQLAANYKQIGVQLESIDVIGGDGLLALKDAMAAAVSESEEVESSEYLETDVKPTVPVELVLTSVKKDLKIKFTNRTTGKLIANIPFEVEVTSPGGKVSTWVDEDMDGIIYEKNISSGKYTVSLIPLEDEKYNKYLMLASNERVDVKENIEYEKVDVSAEIKDESEIDVSKEEENVEQTPIESVNEDTVAWVESTVTYIGDSYKEINKSDIKVPVIPEGATAQEGTESTETTVAQLGGMEDSEISVMSLAATAPISEVTSTVTPSPTPGVEESPSPTPGVEETPSPTPGVEESPSPTPGVEESPSPTPGEEETPSPSPTPIPEEPLITKDGISVYVKEGDTYRVAMTSDYIKTNTKFYIKESGYKYTGWNTIDGYVYYFDANGKPVTGKQVIRGAVYQFDSNGRLNNGSGVMGIDVSSHNGSIDWTAVANSGVDYVIIRCGYRGYGSGALVEDSKFRYNINGALNAGLKVGVYFFSQALDEIEAVEEASMVLNLISGYNITFPVFLDVEYSNSNHDGRADGLDVATRTAVCKAFCQTITNAGYKAGVYANKSWLENYIDAGALSGYKIWLAQYAKEPTYKGKYDMWQYSCTGSISGIKGNVDLNMSYMGY